MYFWSNESHWVSRTCGHEPNTYDALICIVLISLHLIMPYACIFVTQLRPCPATENVCAVKRDSLISLAHEDAIKDRQWASTKCVCTVCGIANTFGDLESHQTTAHQMIACCYCYSNFDKSQMDQHVLLCLDAPVRCTVNNYSGR